MKWIKCTRNGIPCFEGNLAIWGKQLFVNASQETIKEFCAKNNWLVTFLELPPESHKDSPDIPETISNPFTVIKD